MSPQKTLNKWIIFPDQLSTGKFRGFENRDDPTQTAGGFVLGQNVKFGGASQPSTRDGSEVIGTRATDTTPVQRAWVFRRRDNTQIELKAYNTGLYAWVQGISTEFAMLKGSFTAAQEFGFANIGQSDQTFNWLFLCNGTENPFRWTGAYAQYASDNGVNQITVGGSTTLSNRGFTATGTIIINATEITYTGLSGQTFTGCSAVPAAPSVDDMIFQTPVELTGVVGGGTDPGKFVIAMAHDGRLHYRDESKKSVWVYSMLDNPDDITPGSTDGDGGTKEVEFGGSITAFGKLNQTMLCFKQNIIKALDFVQGSTRIDVPRYTTLVSADDKSTTIGAINARSTFSTPYGMVFVTPDKRLLLLTGVTQNNEPEYLVLSDPIQPIFTAGLHDDATGICVDNVIYYAFKSDLNATCNDTVLRGDMTRRSVDRDGKVLPVQWDTPAVGWNVKDWTTIYNSTTGENEVHWHSSTNSNTYKVLTDQKSDDTNPYTSIVRTHAEVFGVPDKQKRVDYVFVELKMSENTEITATVLYDENGVTQQIERTLSGSSANHKFTDIVYNPFGASSFGSQVFGSNAAANDLPRYRFVIELPYNAYFFNVSLQLSAENAGQNFELIRYGWRLVEVVDKNDQLYLV